MNTKPKAKKFRIRRDAPLRPSPQEKPQAAALPPPPAARSGQVESAKSASAETALDAIRREGLTGRQLRMARRVAQKQGIAATSDFDAVLQLRQVGVDPFQRNTILELVAPDGKTDAAPTATLAQMEATRIEANRRVCYLSMGVEPIASDETTYRRAFENTMLAFLIFSGIYLMILLTSSILHEQVTA